MSKKREVNRKQRKARWIRVRNEMRRYPECNYGDFYCHHYIEDRPDGGPVWADFRFFHSKLKRYFAVSMTTAVYDVFVKAEDAAFDKAFSVYPFEEKFEDLFLPSPDNPGYYEIRPSTDLERTRIALARDILEQNLLLDYSITPSISVHDYGDVAVGVYATVNKSKIDEHVIREFIARFRELGEPIKPGWKWEDEAITITSQDLRRFSRNKTAES